MSDKQIYKPYENWKEFNIIEENGKKFLELYNYKLQKLDCYLKKY